MASFLLTETMRLRRELKLESYDRLFPSQDTLPQGGFGNLIALPFQFHPRKLGHSLFVDSRFEALPWEHQWQFLAGIERLEGDRVRALAKEAVRTGRVLGVPQPTPDDEDDDTPWKPMRPPTLATKLPFAVPPEVKAVLAQRLFVEKAGLPTPLVSRLRRIAAFQNPEFYKRQKLRLSTARTPRIIVCAEDLPRHLALPRACVDDVRTLLEFNDSRLVCDDQRNRGKSVALTFQGTLIPEQEAAVRAMLPHDLGVLVAPPGAGKTVMGASMVAARGVNTLVLVHRRPLLEQWVNQLALFLGIDPNQIGRIGGGKIRPNGTLDVAMTLRRANILTGYRHVCRRRGCGHAELAPHDDVRRCPKCQMKLWPAPQSRPLRFHDIRHSTASLLIMAGAGLPAVQRIMRHTDPRITTEFYAHLSPGYLRSAIDRLAINPNTPDELPAAASATASAPTKRPREAAEPPEFAAPLLQPFENGDFGARGDSEKSPVFADLEGSGISGSNRRHSAWEGRGRCSRE